jgi:hypothetical protein
LTHISKEQIYNSIGRHSEAPDVAGDDVIENIVWGTSEESDERCGTEVEGHGNHIIGCMHVCSQLKLNFALIRDL